MQEDYNWDIITKVAVPIAAAEAVIFYLRIGNLWKWGGLAAGLLLAAMLVYIKAKRKSSIFTAIGLVFLAALIVKFLRDVGII